MIFFKVFFVWCIAGIVWILFKMRKEKKLKFKPVIYRDGKKNIRVDYLRRGFVSLPLGIFLGCLTFLLLIIYKNAHILTDLKNSNIEKLIISILAVIFSYLCYKTFIYNQVRKEEEKKKVKELKKKEFDRIMKEYEENN